MLRLSLLVVFCFCLLGGCSPGSKSSSTLEQAPPRQSFQCPALSFDYPGTLFPKHSTNGQVIFQATSLDPADGPNNLTHYDLQELIILNVVQKFQSDAPNTIELQQANLRDLEQLGNITLISTAERLQDDIPILEYILSSPQGSLHMKQYFHCSGGDIFTITISTPEDNWTNISDTVETLERTLEFKS